MRPAWTTSGPFAIARRSKLAHKQVQSFRLCIRSVRCAAGGFENDLKGDSEGALPASEKLWGRNRWIAHTQRRVVELRTVASRALTR